MGILNCASFQSQWRGYEYYQAKKAVITHRISDTQVFGVVAGTEGNQYQVHLDVAHPRKCTCNCPHADGKRINCKHQVALYFTLFPQEAILWKDDVDSQEDRALLQQEQELNNLLHAIHAMKKSELEALVLEMMSSGPEWQYRRLVDRVLYDCQRR